MSGHSFNFILGGFQRVGLDMLRLGISVTVLEANAKGEGETHVVWICKVALDISPFLLRHIDVRTIS